MHDYPNHLARVHILHQYSTVDSYRALYEQDWYLIPNIAMDVIIPGLLNLMSIESASRVFLSLTVISFNLGLLMLGLAAGRHPHWTVLGATFFTYNLTFLMDSRILSGIRHILYRLCRMAMAEPDLVVAGHGPYDAFRFGLLFCTPVVVRFPSNRDWHCDPDACCGMPGDSMVPCNGNASSDSSADALCAIPVDLRASRSNGMVASHPA
jgi:hypothetical protein